MVDSRLFLSRRYSVASLSRTSQNNTTWRKIGPNHADKQRPQGPGGPSAGQTRPHVPDNPKKKLIPRYHSIRLPLPNYCFISSLKTQPHTPPIMVNTHRASPGHPLGNPHIYAIDPLSKQGEAALGPKKDSCSYPIINTASGESRGSWCRGFAVAQRQGRRALRWPPAPPSPGNRNAQNRYAHARAAPPKANIGCPPNVQPMLKPLHAACARHTQQHPAGSGDHPAC